MNKNLLIVNLVVSGLSLIAIVYAGVQVTEFKDGGIWSALWGGG